MHKLKGLIHTLVLGIALSSGLVFALEYREKIKGTIVKVSENRKRIIINRGKEDGLVLQDMANFSVDGKYLLTGVAIIINAEYSEWFVHRTYTPKAITENTQVDILSLYGPNKPQIKNLAEIQSNSFLKELKDEYLDANKERLEEERLKKEQLLFKKYSLERYQSFNLPRLKLDLEISPVSLNFPREERLLSVGQSAQNIDQKEYVFNQSLRFTQAKYENRFSHQKLARTHHDFMAGHESLNFWKQYNSYSFFSYKKRVEDTVAPVDFQVLLGFFGLKRHFKLHYLLPEFNVSYVPSLEFFSGDTLEHKLKSNTSYWRHHLSANAFIRWNEKLTAVETMTMAPRLKFRTIPFSLKEVFWQHEFKLNYNFSPQLSLSFENKFDYDSRFQENLGVKAGEWVNGLYLHYAFELKDLFI